MYPLYDYGFWTVVLKSTGEIIGLCGLGQLEIDGAMCTDLGYYICPKWRRQGIASECIGIALDYAKNYLELTGLYAVTEKDNTLSQKLLYRFGFQPLGSLSEGNMRQYFWKAFR